jgi:hypothetical protein
LTESPRSAISRRAQKGISYVSTPRPLVERYRLGEDPAALARVPDAFAVLTPASVKAVAKLYFNMGRYVQVIPYPESR